MVLFVIVFIDPWLFPLYSGFSGSIEDEITIAIAAALFGTAVWWGIGWAIGEAISIFRGKMKLFNQSALPPAANVMTAAGAPVGPPFGAADRRPLPLQSRMVPEMDGIFAARALLEARSGGYWGGGYGFHLPNSVGRDHRSRAKALCT
jgi:hypothetical protein